MSIDIQKYYPGSVDIDNYDIRQALMDNLAPIQSDDQIRDNRYLDSEYVNTRLIPALTQLTDQKKIAELKAAVETNSDLKDLVEKFTYTPFQQDIVPVEWMKETAIKNKIILTGSLIIEEEGKYYNRLIWMLPNGQFTSYDKRHLFAFVGEDKYFAAGNKRLIASVKGWRINLQVCYDLRFPVWARQQQNEDKPEYDVLIYVANWPERRSHAWKTLLCA